ncbi:MAG: glycosyltransferase family 25 protein [Pseudomonadota bacterium]
MAHVPITIVNLDRRPDRLAYMTDQLDALGLSWQRVSALDGKEVGPEGLDPRTLGNGPIPMTHGSKAYASTMLKTFAAQEAEVMLYLQDDADLSPDLATLLANISWLPEEIGLVQLEKWPERNGLKLLGPSLGTLPVPGRTLHRLYSRTGGAACFLIRKRAAHAIANVKHFVIPTDHMLFSPNTSPVFRDIGVGIVAPALAIQRREKIKSDMAAWRPRTTKLQHLRRAPSEVATVPMQVAAMLTGARWRDTRFEAITTPTKTLRRAET